MNEKVKMFYSRFLVGCLGLFFGVMLCELLFAIPVVYGFLPQPMRALHEVRGNLRVDFEFEPDLVYTLKPGGEIVQLPGANIGARDDGIDGQRPYAVCVGDSFTYGLKVPIEKTWPERLELKTGRDFTNLGVPGYSSLSGLRMLSKYGLKLRPKIAIYGFWCDDIHGVLQPQNLHLKFRGKETVFSSMRQWMSQHLISYNLIKYVLQTKTYRDVIVDSAKLDLETGMTFSKLHLKLGNLSLPAYSGAWEETTVELLRVQEQCRKEGVRFIVVGFPLKEDVYWHRASSILSLKGKAHPHHWLGILERFCNQNSIEFLDVTEVLRRHARKGEQLYFFVDAHWNERGHEVIANYLYESLNGFPE